MKLGQVFLQQYTCGRKKIKIVQEPESGMGSKEEFQRFDLQKKEILFRAITKENDIQNHG